MVSDCPIPHPDNWEVVSLSEICSKIGSGATPKGGQSTYLDARDNYAFIRSQNVFDRYFSNDGLAFISDDQAAELKKVELQEDDLLLNITGDGITFARSCLVPASILPACVNQHVSIIRVKPEIANPGYVLGYLTHKDIKPYIESFNAGGSRRAITKGHIESFRLALPPLPEQTAIANILGSLDDKIELNRKMNATLEAIAQALFKSWFVDFDPVIDNAIAANNPIPEPLQARAAARRALGDKRKPLPPDIQQLFGDRFVFNDDLGWIPEGCKVGTFESIAENIKENVKADEVGEFNFYVGLEHIGRKELFLSDHASGDSIGSNKSLFTEKDLLFGKLRPYFHKVCLAPQDGICSTDILVFRSKEAFLLSFMTLTAYQDEFVEYANLRSTGTRMPRASAKDMLNFPIIIPIPEIAEIFESKVSVIWATGMQSIEESRDLAKLRDTLLPKLLSGQIRIPDAEALVAEAI